TPILVGWRAVYGAPNCRSGTCDSHGTTARTWLAGRSPGSDLHGLFRIPARVGGSGVVTLGCVTVRSCRGSGHGRVLTMDAALAGCRRGGSRRGGRGGRADRRK